jgi:hypothetical protein
LTGWLIFWLCAKWQIVFLAGCTGMHAVKKASGDIPLQPSCRAIMIPAIM